ncbi:MULTISPECIES: hypothetical protein [unclassified Streptomyces]|uniref:hypothetical protein n=1 Tax=unclassified Streptomyces TaxID=2593676 RepID=UPI000DAD8367|nr:MULTISPECIES: hypothetical protein [unclassified Streptomyces]PZT77268.1 hypothetical protein DNK56_29110 [Streptomyces sp. AC1-42W]PZT78780.1 hypothetical protein DNK55_03570 [Streptomyces sp. AC1-42T]
MKRRIAMIAATAAAAIAIPLAGATTAQASAWHYQGAYYTLAECQAAGEQGAILWGPLFGCTPMPMEGHTWYALMVH